MNILTPHDIETRIAEDLDALEAATEAYKKLLIEEAKAEYEYKSYRHEVFLNTQGPVRVREAEAEYQAKDKLRAYLGRQAQAKGARELLTTIRTRLDALRSLNANVRPQAG